MTEDEFSQYLLDKGRSAPEAKAIEAAGAALAASVERQEARTPRQAALAAHHQGHRLTVDQIEDRIRAQRGLRPLNRRGPTDASPPPG